MSTRRWSPGAVPAGRTPGVTRTKPGPPTPARAARSRPEHTTPASPQRAIHSDAVARVAGGLVYVVNRIFADNIQILDPSRDFVTMVQCSTGNGSNPHDIVIAGDTKAYVTLYDTGEILVVNPAPAADCSDFERGRIDVSPFADADGNPEADQMAIVSGELYVLLQRLDRNNFFTPAGRGGLQDGAFGWSGRGRGRRNPSGHAGPPRACSMSACVISTCASAAV